MIRICKKISFFTFISLSVSTCFLSSCGGDAQNKYSSLKINDNFVVLNSVDALSLKMVVETKLPIESNKNFTELNKLVLNTDFFYWEFCMAIASYVITNDVRISISEFSNTNFNLYVGDQSYESIIKIDSTLSSDYYVIDQQNIYLKITNDLLIPTELQKFKSWIYWNCTFIV